MNDEDETEALSKTLIWTIGMITQSGPGDRERIALAYEEALELVASIPKDNGNARPRIVACFERSTIYRTAEDIACAGWLLVAMQERVNEQNLPDWRKLRKIINNTMKMLPLPQPTVH
ncbi:hypothetical protein CFBP4996_26180 (plasmid) [Agrobacterium leguminum]|uniref:hypothetical protein n=1 Tax=Agrobacterium leguminum TaxID=2792015 RepID=UPI0010C9C4E8|nr:hypothetical protein [Agrobacterium leguminum]WFS69563.1 hypothetical protein CFBP4996_26180 [Agrobacterium leguminum]